MVLIIQNSTMQKLHLMVFCLNLISTLAEGPSLLLSTAIRINNITVSYPTGVISERDLNVCQERSACNIIHKRFWFPPLIERLCRCPYRNECPWTWSPAYDNQTIYVNNRAQMKFCTDLSKLPTCTNKKPAIIISTIPKNRQFNMSNNHATLQNNERWRRHSDHRNITISCNCRELHYWKLRNTSDPSVSENGHLQQTYYCSKLKKCAGFDFCGHVRLDTHSTFYRCSCPKGHMCITKNKVVYEAEEILYNGDSYKAYCLPYKQRNMKP